MSVTEKDLNDLVGWLENQSTRVKGKEKSGMADLAKLKKEKQHLARNEVLIAAHDRGLIQFGRRNYSSNCTAVRLEPPTKEWVEMPEKDRPEQVQIQTLEYRLDDDWSWAELNNPQKPNRCTVPELLDEDKEWAGKKISLRVGDEKVQSVEALSVLGLWIRRTGKALLTVAA